MLDDLRRRGRMELLLSTMNGNMHLFETDTPYHPLRSWTSREQVPPRALVCVSRGVDLCVCLRGRVRAWACARLGVSFFCVVDLTPSCTNNCACNAPTRSCRFTLVAPVCAGGPQSLPRARPLRPHLHRDCCRGSTASLRARRTSASLSLRQHEVRQGPVVP
jgi:hypothetical protein